MWSSHSLLANRELGSVFELAQHTSPVSQENDCFQNILCVCVCVCVWWDVLCCTALSNIITSSHCQTFLNYEKCRIAGLARVSTESNNGSEGNSSWRTTVGILTHQWRWTSLAYPILVCLILLCILMDTAAAVSNKALLISKGKFTRQPFHLQSYVLHWLGFWCFIFQKTFRFYYIVIRNPILHLWGKTLHSFGSKRVPL